MGILGTKVPPADGLPPGAPRGRDAERILAGEMLEALRSYQQTMTEFAERVAGRITNHVLEVATRPFDSSGVISRQYGAAAGAIEVTNLSVAASVAASNHPANPGAGAEVSITVPAGETWTLQSLDLTLTTSAAVANRQVQLIIDDGVNELWRILVTVTQAATLVYVYAFGGSVNDAAVRAAAGINEVLAELPAITLGAGYRIRTSTIAIQAGDQYSAITVGYVKATVGHSVTVVSAAAAAGNTAPAAGTGVYVVPPGVKQVIPLASREVTLYGTAGDSVSYAVFTSGPSPAVV